MRCAKRSSRRKAGYERRLTHDDGTSVELDRGAIGLLGSSLFEFEYSAQKRSLKQQPLAVQNSLE